MARRRSTQTPAIPNALVWGLGAAFMVATLVTAILTFLVVRDMVAGWGLGGGEQQANNPPLQISTPAPQVTVVMNEPLQVTGRPTPAPWDGQERFNVLLMGLDYRDWSAGDGPARTDTMILLTYDPQTNTAGMLSIPRDLWVNIPGFNYAKINTAYYLGELYQTPGGGPALAMQTVQNFLGVPVPYYAQVDFGAFVRFINELGGIKVDVPEEITLDLIGDGEETIKTLQPGVQVIPGDIALAYARARNTAGSDFDRANRQQQVIFAIRDRVLSLDLLPTLVTRAPAIYTEISTGIDSNLTLDQIIRLAWALKDMPRENITQALIGPDQVNFGTSYDGQSILLPIPEEVRIVRDQIFMGRAGIEPVAAATSGNAAELMEAESAAVVVQNGTYTPGLAGETTEFLAGRNVNVVEAGNADQIYEFTTVVDYTGNPYTLQYLVGVLNIQDSQIFSSYDPYREYDVLVILGNDWANNNTMP